MTGVRTPILFEIWRTQSSTISWGGSCLNYVYLFEQEEYWVQQQNIVKKSRLLVVDVQGIIPLLVYYPACHDLK